MSLYSGLNARSIFFVRLHFFEITMFVNTPTENCLATKVRTILMESGLGQRVAQFYDTHPYIQNAYGKPPAAQRSLLNRYWDIQLKSADKVSIDQSFCLIPNGEDSDWLRLFRNTIIPFALDNNLPGYIG